ncbi:MAG TPA: NAD(P)H-hydrate epimerase, partial [Nitrososphaeraceae archaeon]|nr:NAD(P)H-hydrate epimerase [Nitrososphaeraceae archaeon]
KKQSEISKKFEEKIISSEQMYKIENIGHNKFGMKKMLMMENAGFGVAEFILKKFKNKKLENFKILAVCGTGNNGGDAMVAARHLASLNLNIRIILLGDPTLIKTDEASTNFQVINKMNRTIDLVKLKNIDTKIKKDILDADIVIDGIFGTGIKGDILNPHLSIIKLINKSKAYIISVDIPSGLNPDNGETVSQCIKADTTITFHRIKSGLINNDQYTGDLILKKIGIPIETEEGLI